MIIYLQPISWLSFLLLIATGAGVIIYYDQEKKRHIEGKVDILLLWPIVGYLYTCCWLDTLSSSLLNCLFLHSRL